MPADTMRSTMNPAAALGKTLQTPRHHRGHYPQWMKTLEEKYEKLHKKIENNTSMMAWKYPQLAGRTVYDARLAKALSKYNEANGTGYQRSRSVMSMKSSNSKKVSNTCGSVVISKQTITQNNSNQINEESRLDKNDVRATISQSPVCNIHRNTSSEADDIESSDNEVKDPENIYEDKPANENESQIDINSLNENVELNSHKEREHALSIQADESSENGNDGIRKSSAKENKEIPQKRQRKSLERNVKTPLSRTSRNTSKSCPAQIQASQREKAANKRLHLRSKSAHKKAQKEDEMFNRMSEEAQYAITETIQEMNINRSKTTITVTGRQNNRAVNGQLRKNPKATLLSSKERLSDENLKEERTVLQEQRRGGQDEYDASSGLSGDTFGETDRFPSAGLNRERLPDIQTENVTGIRLGSSQFIKGHQCRIPGVGKYDIPYMKEGTFEITPPGFDSRYADIAVPEERESETPPPDIRERAIQKCSEWLHKYSTQRSDQK